MATEDVNLTLQYKPQQSTPHLEMYFASSTLQRRQQISLQKLLQSSHPVGSPLWTKTWHYKQQPIKALTGFHRNLARAITNKQP
jgi:hypothetical protein